MHDHLEGNCQQNTEEHTSLDQQLLMMRTPVVLLLGHMGQQQGEGGQTHLKARCMAARLLPLRSISFTVKAFCSMMSSRKPATTCSCSVARQSVRE